MPEPQPAAEQPAGEPTPSASQPDERPDAEQSPAVEAARSSPSPSASAPVAALPSTAEPPPAAPEPLPAAPEPMPAAPEPMPSASAAGSVTVEQARPTTVELARSAPGEQTPAAPDEPPGESRWVGSAPVPPAPPRKRRWLQTLVGIASDPPPPLPSSGRQPVPRQDPPGEPGRGPTEDREPAEDQEPLETRTPVDPWAGADLWSPHGMSPHTDPYPPVEPYPPARAYPPTRVYPVGDPLPLPVPPARAGRSLPATPRRPVRWGRRARATPPPYGPPPPGWRPPPGYVPVAVRRRRRWPWFLLLSIACCCGVPAYLGAPMLRQYPATAVLPAQIADLRLRDDPASKRVAQRLKGELLVNYWTADPFAGTYSSSDGKRVILFGVTGFRLSPEDDVDTEINRLTPDYDIVDVREIETGSRGEYLRCGTGRANDTDVVVCTWTDHGSVVTGMFTRLSVDNSAQRLAELRTSIISRG